MRKRINVNGTVYEQVAWTRKNLRESVSASQVEDDLLDVLQHDYHLDEDEIDEVDVYRFAKDAAKAWEGDGWYQVMLGRHAWGYQDPEWREDPVTLAASLYNAHLSEPLQDCYASYLGDGDEPED